MITAPSDNTILPEDLTKAIEIGKNNLTLMQSETNRLQKLKGQLEKEIGTLSVQKTDLENIVSGFVASKENLASQVGQIRTSLEVASKRLEDVRTEEADALANITVLNQDLVDKTMKIQADRNILTAKQFELVQSIQTHQKDKDILLQKKTLLENTIKQL